MKKSRRLTTSLLLAAGCCFGACSSGGGGTAAATPDGPQLPVSIPEGTGLIDIDMAGTWAIQNAVVSETNSSTAGPPPDGTLFVLEASRINSIGGLSVSPGFLELVLGNPLRSYVNILDGRTLLYGAVVDGRSGGGTREEVAVAGGAIDANAISVEAYTSTQTASSSEPLYTIARYDLVRVNGTVPVAFEYDNGPPLAEDERDVLRRRLWAKFGDR